MKKVEYKRDILKERIEALSRIREALEKGESEDFQKRIDELINRIIEERDQFMKEIEENETMTFATKAFMIEAVEERSNNRIEMLNRVREGEYELLSKAIADLARELHTGN